MINVWRTSKIVRQKKTTLPSSLSLMQIDVSVDFLSFLIGYIEEYPDCWQQNLLLSVADYPKSFTPFPIETIFGLIVLNNHLKSFPVSSHY